MIFLEAPQGYLTKPGMKFIWIDFLLQGLVDVVPHRAVNGFRGDFNGVPEALDIFTF